MKKLLFISALLLSQIFLIKGQDDFTTQFSKPDMEAKLWLEFFKGDSSVFVIPDTKLSHNDSSLLKNCKKSRFTKRESQLTEEDYAKKTAHMGSNIRL